MVAQMLNQEGPEIFCAPSTGHWLLEPATSCRWPLLEAL